MKTPKSFSVIRYPERTQKVLNQMKALEEANVKLRAALCLVQEQEKRGYLSYCGVNYTKKAVDEAIESTKPLNPQHPKTTPL